MKRLACTAIALTMALGLVSTAAAADRVRDADRAAFTLDRGHWDSKDLIGLKVETPDGKRAGKLERLLFDQDGKMTHAVVAIGGFAGVARHDVVVPWSKVKLTREGKRRDLVAMIDRAALDTAPRYSYTRFDRDAGAASPRGDRDRDGTPNRLDRAPNNPNKQ